VEAVPNSIFIGNVDAIHVCEKTVHVIGRKEQSLKVVGVSFPEGVEGAYDVADATAWDKAISVKMRFPIIEKSIGKFVLTVSVSDTHSKIHALMIPCVYIGAPSTKAR
jgi:hypothetical protein